MSNATIIFYYAPDREVMWEDESPQGRDMQTLAVRMRDWIANGHTFEILEFHPNGLPDSEASERCTWWDIELAANFGYDTPENRMYNKKEDPHA